MQGYIIIHYSANCINFCTRNVSIIYFMYKFINVSWFVTLCTPSWSSIHVIHLSFHSSQLCVIVNNISCAANAFNRLLIKFLIILNEKSWTGNDIKLKFLNSYWAVYIFCNITWNRIYLSLNLRVFRLKLEMRLLLYTHKSLLLFFNTQTYTHTHTQFQ